MSPVVNALRELRYALSREHMVWGKEPLAGRIEETLKFFVWKILRRFGLPGGQWVRAVMNKKTADMVAGLHPESLNVLELSGETWKDHSFLTYKSVGYPDFDICADVLDEQFDLIIAEQVFEHLEWPYRAGKNVYAMLTPGGHFLVTTPFLVRIHNCPIDCSRWTEKGLAHLLAECGFPLEEIQTGSWGNRQCIRSHIRHGAWRGYIPFLHSLKNERLYPVQVWALASKGPA